MGKAALIFSTQKSSWKSCEFIVKNLRSAYYHAYGETFEEFNYNFRLHEYKIYQLACDIVNSQVDKLIFLDHRPHPLSLLKFLHELVPEKKYEITFHVYGDFVLNFDEWWKSQDLLRHHNCRFVCASHKQVSLVKSFMKDPQGLVYYCPFPVNSSEFHFDENLRVQTRKQFQIDDEEPVFTYTGRICVSKLCIELIESFIQSKKMFKIPGKLFFAGNFDDRINPYANTKLANGAYYHLFLEKLKSLPDAYKDDVKYLGNFDREGLRSICHLTDYFVSLSVYNDEDYGMSPIESLMCGSQAMLSDWGGYTSFQLDEFPDYCRLIPTEINELGPQVKTNHFFKDIVRASQQVPSAGTRCEVSSLYKKHFSIERAAKLIKEILQAPMTSFSGWNEMAQKCGEKRQLRTVNAFLDQRTRFSDLYREVYSHYESQQN